MSDNSTESDQWQPNQSVRIVITAIFGSLLLTGIVGNVLVITLILLVKTMRSAVNLCLASLALSDLIVLVFLPIKSIAELYDVDESFLGKPLCFFVQSVNRSAVVCSTLTFLLIAVERYTVVCYPLKTLGFWTRAKVCLLLAVIWTLAVGVSIPHGYVVSYRRYQEDNVTFYKCSIGRAIPWVQMYDVGVIFTTFFLPIPFLLYLYGKIIITLKTEVPESDSQGSGAREARRGRSKIIKILIVVVVIFVGSLLPFQIFYLLNIFAEETFDSWGDKTNFAILWLSRFLAYINFLANPVVYFAMSDNFRQAFQLLFCRCRKTTQAVSLTSNTGVSSYKVTAKE